MATLTVHIDRFESFRTPSRLFWARARFGDSTARYLISASGPLGLVGAAMNMLPKAAAEWAE
jgi:hypothetical protein